MKTADISAYATTGFPAKWRRSLRNKRKNSILMTCRLPYLVSASDWLCPVGNLLPPIRNTIQIWVYSMEFLRLFLRGHFALKPVLVSWNVGCFLRYSCWPLERKRSVWIRHCNLNVLVFFFFSFCLVVKNWRWRFWRNNGYRITTEIHSFKWCIQAGKSWFF